MRYRELLELYRKKELGEQEREMVEQDIEKHEAISEYLFEREESDTLNFGADMNQKEDTEPGQKRKDGAGGDEFTKRVNRAIRRAFLKMGAAVCAVTLVIVLLTLFVLPGAVSQFYYDPGKSVGQDSYGGTTNQMSLDMAVYTELALPGTYRNNVQVEDRGYGNYDIYIYQNVSRTGRFQNTAGQIQRGELRLYDINQFRLPVSNVFGWFQMDMDQEGTLTEQIEDGQGQYFGASGDRELCLENLNALDDNSFYLAYVTLDKIMSYEAFLEFAEVQSDSIMDVWCAPRTMAEGAYQAAGRPANLGFYTSLGQSSSVEWDREKYPDLVIWSYGDDPASGDEAGEKIADETSAGEHFAVMLDYMSEQEEFLEMMEQSPEKFAEAADYVRENGLEIYGFACIAQKDTLLELMETDEVYGIYTVEYN